MSKDDVVVRFIRMRDAKALEHLVTQNRPWLKPWEATSPDAPASFDFRRQIRALLRQQTDQIGLPFVIEISGEVVGQINVGNILYGSVSGASIGYWISPEFAGRGIMPKAVALVIDYLFTTVGLHRIQIDIRPENKASLRVVEKLGLRYEGYKRRYIHINGEWRDHYSFALTEDEVTNGLMNRWILNQTPRQAYPWNRPFEN